MSKPPVFALAPWAAAFLFPSLLLAEPYFAFHEGYKCSACHVNHTGGGKRTAFGMLYPQTDLQPLLGALSDKAGNFSAQAGSSFSLGADLMVVHEVLFSAEEKGRPAGRSSDTTFVQDAQNTFDIRSGQFYLEAQLVPEVLTLYLDEIVTPAGAQSREALILWQKLPLNGYFKAGRLFLPYGIRLWDDESFIRQVTGFNFDNQDMGVELGIEPANTFLSVAFSNGTQGTRDNNDGKQVSSVGSVYLKNVILGGSFAFNKSRGIERLVAGPYASVRLGPFTLMGEADWMRDSGAGEQQQFILFGSLDYWHRQGLNLRLVYDYLDPYYKYRAPGAAKAENLEEDEKSRLTLGVDAILTPFLSASAYYKFKKSVPQDVQGNADALTVALHAFF